MSRILEHARHIALGVGLAAFVVVSIAIMMAIMAAPAVAVILLALSIKGGTL